MDADWLRRARPLLGTLVEVGVPVGCEAAMWRAFEVIEGVQQRMSIHDARSDLSRLHAMPVGEACEVHPWTAEVLQMAAALHEQTQGLFDVARGSGRWSCASEASRCFAVRHDPDCHLDLGGIAKGWAVDQAVDAVKAMGVDQVWVNAGGDVRCAGVGLPISLRDEQGGGVRPWITLHEGALATSWYAAGSRVQLHGPQASSHVSVAAPRCAMADAFTKLVAITGPQVPEWLAALLQQHEAEVWWHDAAVSPA